MSKQVWNNGELTIQLDPTDPNESAQITINQHRGKSIAALLPAELVQLLTTLNTRYNLGLRP